MDDKLINIPKKNKKKHLYITINVGNLDIVWFYQAISNFIKVPKVFEATYKITLVNIVLYSPPSPPALLESIFNLSGRQLLIASHLILFLIGINYYKNYIHKKILWSKLNDLLEIIQG